MRNVVSVTKSTISLVVMVLSTISTDKNEANVLDYYCKISKLELKKNTVSMVMH